MQQEHSWVDDADAADADRQTASLAGAAITLLLLVVGLYLVRTLYTESAVEDCLMAGRLNCDLLVGAVF